MNPIKCPHCNENVTPHETDLQLFLSCYDYCVENEKFFNLSLDLRTQLAVARYTQLKLDQRTRMIQDSKKANIKAINKKY